jgi:MoxR-like ATPase
VTDVAVGLKDVEPIGRRILTEVEKAVVGKRRALELVLLGLLADGHVLIEDNPGLAKTLIARSFARTAELTFARVQFTPDLMPADITGSTIFNQRMGEFEFRPGPIFANLVLGDEINRAPPKTQAALLEAMQERQVTIDGVTHPLQPPFFVLATQNPIEYEGTYPLPEAQLDRFILRTRVGYLSAEQEWELLERRMARKADEVELAPVVGKVDVLAVQVEVGASPRATIALLKLCRARAALHGRDFVVPEDVKALAVPALAHRLVLRSELWARRVRPDDVVAGLLSEVPTPAAEDLDQPLS